MCSAQTLEGSRPEAEEHLSLLVVSYAMDQGIDSMEHLLLAGESLSCWSISYTTLVLLQQSRT